MAKETYVDSPDQIFELHKKVFEKEANGLASNPEKMRNSITYTLRNNFQINMSFDDYREINKKIKERIDLQMEEDYKHIGWHDVICSEVIHEYFNLWDASYSY